ncbi:MAG: LysR family transcriptional regulator [Bdellovibrionota bacterium]
MDLNEIAVFIKVVQAGSFRQAAKLLEMPNSTVSSKISSLEKRLGITLLQRTTRKLNLTQAGQSFYEESLAGLVQIKNAEARANFNQQEVLGTLKVTAPVEFGNYFLPLLSTQYLKAYPKMNLEYQLSDTAIDLISNSVDLAIRIGNLKDSSLIVKKIGSVHFGVFASPTYLKTHGIPKEPKDLSKHSCIHFTQLENNKWHLNSTKSTSIINVQPKIRSNELNMIKALTAAGEGIALLPAFTCCEEIKRRKLIRPLPEWKSSIKPVHFVYPAQKYVPPKVKSFMEITLQPLQALLSDKSA